jgi:hypothetical protein
MSQPRGIPCRPQWLALAGAVIVAVLAGAGTAGCATGQAVATGPFARADQIGTELHRGVSTKADVERLLGKPNGRGMTLLPTQDSARELWTYMDMQTGDAKSEGRAMGVATVRLDMRAQEIYVFFDGDRFDGYLWATFVEAATVAPR